MSKECHLSEKIHTCFFHAYNNRAFGCMQCIGHSKQDKKVNENNDEIIYEGSENEWELSSTFEHSVIYEDGGKGSYTVVGSTERVGFTGSFPIIAKEPQKYFWFYFDS